MKLLSKNKIIVSALALCIGASLAGSVSGTIAWYQYSTRANVAFIGEAGGFSGNLQMRFVSEANDDDAWRTRITWQEMNNELTNNLPQDVNDLKIVPMTFGALGKDSELPQYGYTQPRPGIAAMANWGKAETYNYAQFQLQLRYKENDENVAENVYLTKLLIQEDANNGQKGDISDAVRVHISSSYGNSAKNKLYSNLGKEIAVKGALDIDGDGENDKGYADSDEFGFTHQDTDLQEIIYGDDGDAQTEEIQRSYKAGATDAVGGVKYTQEEIDAATDPSDPAHGKTVNDWKVEPVFPALVYSNQNNKLYDESDEATLPDPSKSIGQTVAANDSYLTVKVTIWVEGWQKFDNAETAIWNTKYIGSKFNIGIQFAVQDKLA